jgi:hypothetical protein
MTIGVSVIIVCCSELTPSQACELRWIRAALPLFQCNRTPFTPCHSIFVNGLIVRYVVGLVRITFMVKWAVSWALSCNSDGAEPRLPPSYRKLFRRYLPSVAPDEPNNEAFTAELCVWLHGFSKLATGFSKPCLTVLFSCHTRCSEMHRLIWA